MGVRVAVIGAGGQGKVVYDLIRALGHAERLWFFDDRYPELRLSGAVMTLKGTVAALFEERYRAEVESFVVAIGANRIRRQFYERALAAGLDPLRLIHPRATLSPLALIGPGTVLCGQAWVGPGAAVGQNCLVNTGATVDHDCRIADHVHICPGARLAGNVRIGAATMVGTGAVVIPGIQIGSNCVIGAGTVVIGDLPANVTAVGNPARIIKENRE